MAAYLMSEGLARFVSGLRRNANRYEAEGGASRPVRPNFAEADDFPLPYTVVWAESVASWIIWLPGHEFMWDGESVSVAADLSEAGAGYPSSWYKLADIASDASAIYLNATRREGEITVEFAEEPAEPEEGEDEEVLAFAIATMSGKAVVQIVSSAIVVGGETAGVTSLNELVGDILLEGSDDGIEIDGKTYYIVAEEDEAENIIYLKLSDKPQSEEDAGDDDKYCNNISDEGNGAWPGNPNAGDNRISEDGDDDDGNNISQDPCKKE